MGLIETLHEERKNRQLRFKKAALKLAPPPPPLIETPPEPTPEPAPEPIAKLGSIPDIILNAVCEHYNFKRKDVISRRRFSDLAKAQRMACYMFHLTTNYTNPKIADIVNRDPSSVGTAIKKAKADPDQGPAQILEEKISALIAIKQKRDRDELSKIARSFQSQQTA